RARDLGLHPVTLGPPSLHPSIPPPRREREREGGREMEGERKREREGDREGGREGERKREIWGGREREREKGRGREKGRESIELIVKRNIQKTHPYTERQKFTQTAAQSQHEHNH